MGTEEALNIVKDFLHKCHSVECDNQCGKCEFNAITEEFRTAAEVLFETFERKGMIIEMPTYSDIEIGREK